MKNFLWMSLLLPALAFSYSGGPPNGLTGAPGEGNCTQCHAGNALNSGNGSLSIDGPSFYTPGEVYTITVSLQDAGQSRWGFEFTPLNKGTLAVTDAATTQSSSAGSNHYIKHTSAGTFDNTGNGPVSWSFAWTAPATDEGEISFYASGNAANSNNSTSGDFIYTTSFVSSPATGLEPAPQPASFALLSVVPNPFNPSAEIRYQLNQAGDVRLDVYDLAGRQVARLVDGTQGAGQHSARWNGQTAAGQAAAAGLYLARLEHNGQAQVTRMLLVK
jgi:hypothetical protein